MKIGFLEVSEKDVSKINELGRKRLYLVGLVFGFSLGVNFSLILFYYFNDFLMNLMGRGILQ